MNFKPLVYTGILFLFCSRGYAQTDTLKMSFQQAEKAFLENNLELIAQRYHIEGTKALILQAKLWDNPSLLTDQNLYDNTHTFFNHKNGNGEVYGVVSQVFKTAGKRGKEVKLAESQVHVEEAAFNVLLRNLQYNLLLDFAQLATLNEQAKVYRTEISAGENLVSLIETAYKTDKTKEKDVIRLKALLFGVENDRVDNSSQVNSLEAEVKTLLHTRPDIFVLPVVKENSQEIVQLDINKLILTAKENRGDYLAAKYQLEYAANSLRYQKSLAVPNITLGVDFDRVNSYAPDYFGLQIGFQLPFFNRNQGNIKSAKYELSSQETIRSENEVRLQNSIIAAVQQYNLSKTLLKDNHIEFNEQYDNLFKSLLNDYRKGKIGLVDFVDFFDSYKDTKLKILQQKYNLQKAIADVNYAVGKVVIQ